MILKQSTAFTQIVGPILDSTGVEYTGAVIGDLSISKNGTEAAMASAATLTHVSNGFYTLVGTTGNSDTLGRLTIRCNKSTYQMPPVHFTVLTATAFDTLVTNGTIASTTSGRTIVTDAAGLVDSNMVKAGPSGSGTAQTTGDIYGKISPSTFPSGTISTYAGADTSGTTTLLTRLTSTRASNLDNLDAAITSLNNLSALANLYGSPLLEIPDSSTTQFAFTLVVRDNEGKLKDLDSSPTITAANAAGTDRSSNLSAVSHPSTGRYTFTYGVASTASEESLRITCSGTISAEARYVEWIGAVVDYDTLTTLTAIKAKTDQLTFTTANKVDATVPDTQKVDVNTVKTQSVTCSSAVTVSPFVGNTGAVLQTDNSGYTKISSGTGTGQISLSSGGVSIKTAGITNNAYSGESGQRALVSGASDIAFINNTSYAVYTPSVTFGTLSTAANFYKGCLLRIIGGNGVGQTRRIATSTYDGGVPMVTFTFKRPWVTNTDENTSYVILASDSALGTDDIDADSIKADAVAEIQSGLATSAQITALNNLSALANLYGSPVLEIPDSSTTQFAFTLVVRDNEGKLVDLDSNPTIAAANAAGTDRSANISAVSHPATGRYTFTYGVSSAATAESLRITCSGTVSAEARYIEWIGAVVDYDSVTMLAAVKAKTDNLPSDPADQSLLEAAITAATSGLASSAGQTAIASNVTSIKAKTDNLPASPAATGDIPTANQNAAALLAATTETGLTFEGYLRATFAALAGASSGLPGGPIIFKSKNGSKDRITAIFDADKNRTLITLDLS